MSDERFSRPERSEGSRSASGDEAGLRQEAGLLGQPKLRIVTIPAAELALPTDSLATGLNGALAWSSQTVVRTATLGLAAPRVVSLPIGRAPTIKSKGFVFPLGHALWASDD